MALGIRREEEWERGQDAQNNALAAEWGKDALCWRFWWLLKFFFELKQVSTLASAATAVTRFPCAVSLCARSTDLTVCVRAVCPGARNSRKHWETTPTRPYRRITFLLCRTTTRETRRRTPVRDKNIIKLVIFLPHLVPTWNQSPPLVLFNVVSFSFFFPANSRTFYKFTVWML